MMSRRQLTVWRGALLAVLVTGLAGCSWFSDDDEAKQEMAPLPAVPEDAVGLDRQWSRRIGGQGEPEWGLALTPVIDGGSIYAANADGGVVAISRADGDVRWKGDVDVPLIGAVGAGDGRVFVCSQDGGVHALDAASGEVSWRAQASSEVLAAPVTDGDVVVVQGVDSRVQAFDAQSGSPRWQYSATQAVLSLRGNAAPVLRDGIAYVAFDNGKVAALDAKTGLLRWEQRVIVPDGRSELERVIDVQADPLVTSSDVVVGTYQGALTSLERESGRPQWQEKASVRRSMAMGDGSIFAVESDDVVRAFRESSGREAWKVDSLLHRVLSAPGVIGDYVAVADGDGYVHLLSQSDGTYRGRYKVGGDGVRANIISDGDVLYVLTASGKLYALSLEH